MTSGIGDAGASAMYGEEAKIEETAVEVAEPKQLGDSGRKRAVWNIPKANKEAKDSAEHIQGEILYDSDVLRKPEENATNSLNTPIVVAGGTEVQEGPQPSPPKSLAF